MTEQKQSRIIDPHTGKSYGIEDTFPVGTKISVEQGKLPAEIWEQSASGLWVKRVEGGIIKYSLGIHPLNILMSFTRYYNVLSQEDFDHLTIPVMGGSIDRKTNYFNPHTRDYALNIWLDIKLDQNSFKKAIEKLEKVIEGKKCIDKRDLHCAVNSYEEIFDHGIGYARAVASLNPQHSPQDIDKFVGLLERLFPETTKIKFPKYTSDRDYQTVLAWHQGSGCQFVK